MSLIDTLKALAITVRNEKKKEANSAVRIGDLFIAIIDFIKSVQSGEIRQDGVDTYNDTSDGKTSLLNKYPIPELNWTVLVRKDETNEGKSSLYKWNGSRWVNLETVVYEDNIQDIINSLQIIQNNEFLFAITDSADCVLWGIRWDLRPYELKVGTATDKELIKLLNEIEAAYSRIDTIEGEITLINNLVQTISNEQFLQYSVDKDGRLLSYITKDGTHYFEKIKLPQDILDKINTGNYNNKSSEQSLQIDFPKSLGKAVIHDLTISSLPLNKSSKFGRISLFIDDVWVTKILEISYQGSSSMNFPEKNFSIDIYNEDGSDFMIKVGKWVATNKFHFKVNWIDATHCRNVGANRIYENMLQTKPVDKIRAWNVPYHWQNGTMDEQIETGAMGHIDGFPIELYFEDEYYGIATLNLTKNRRNYNMNKKDNGSNSRLRIQLELGGGINANCDWTRLNFADFEVRNPDVKTIDGGKYFEGADIEDGAVKNAAQRLFDWLNSVSETDFKTQANDYLMIDSLIDYILLQELTQNSDSWTRNGQLCTWDGLRWTVLPYDLDQAFGLGGTGVMAINANGNSLPPDDKGNSVFWLRILKLYNSEIEARYKELRDLDVFSYKGIETTLRGIVDVIGFEAYKRDLTKWDKPSFRPEEYKAVNPNGFHVDGGFYTSLSHIMTWVEQRLAKLDNDYNYN